MNRKKSDTPASVDVITLVRDCTLVLEQSEELKNADPSMLKILMFAFQTDGGTHQDSLTYFIHRIFDIGTYLYGTRSILQPTKNPVHVQCYGGREAVYTNQAVHQFKEDNMNIKIPIERFLGDPSQPETFKQLTGVRVDKRITHYTCLCNYFMLFFSDREIDCKSSKMLAAFTGVNSIQKFRSLKVPVKTYSTTSQTTEENEQEIKDDYKGNLAYEIDLKYAKSIGKLLNITSNKVDCYPLLWFQLDTKVSQEWIVQIRQKVAFKYCVIKMIDRNKTSGPDN